MQPVRWVRIRRAVYVFLIVLMLTTQITLPLRPARALGPLTIGGLIALSKFALDQINNIAQEAIAAAGDEVRRALDQLRGDLKDLINTLETTYQDNLFLTLDQLDSFTSNKLGEIETFIETLNEQLQEDIKLIAQETRNIIMTASVEISRISADIEQRLTNLVVVATEGVVFILDKTVFNIILIVSLVLLGIGLLMFVWLFFSKRLPDGALRWVVFALMATFIVAFGALAFVPPARAAVMDATGLGLEKRLENVTKQEPQVVGARPRLIEIGKTTSVSLIGVGLRPAGKTITARVGTQSVPVTASTEQEVALNTAGLTLPDGVFDAVLLYDNVESDNARAVVEIKNPPPPLKPADLVVVSFSLSPASPIQRGNTTASIVIRNTGETEARNFSLEWKPFAQSQSERSDGITLAAGETRPFTFNFAYPNPGTVDSVAIVDPTNRVQESREDNNSRTLSNVVVRQAAPRQAQVRVTITQIIIHDKSEPLANGEVRFNFNIGGQTGRFPSSGTRSVGNGAILNVNRTFTLTLTEGQNLPILITGLEEDNPGFPLFDDHDDMGTVSETLRSSEEWGRGTKSFRSSSPRNFTVTMNITVTFLN